MNKYKHEYVFVLIYMLVYFSDMCTLCVQVPV